MFERVVGAIGASIGPENFAPGEREDELWDEEDVSANPVTEDGDPEYEEIA